MLYTNNVPPYFIVCEQKKVCCIEKQNIKKVFVVSEQKRTLLHQKSEDMFNA